MLVHPLKLVHAAIWSCFLALASAEPSHHHHHHHHHAHHGQHGHQEHTRLISMPLMRDPRIKPNTSAEVLKMHARYASSSRWPAVPIYKPSNSRHFYGSISVGVPQQPLTVLFSMNYGFSWLTSTACASEHCLQSKRYDPSNSSTYRYDFGTEWEVRGRDNASVSGRLCSDVVRVGDIPVRLTFGEATSSSVGFSGVAASGMLGLALFAKGTDRNSFLGTAVEHETLNTSTFAMFLNNPAPDGSVSGELQFGRVDESHFDRNLTFSNVSDMSAWKVPVEIIPRMNGSRPSLGGEAVFDPTHEWIAVPEQLAQEFFFALDGHRVSIRSASRLSKYWCVACPQWETVGDNALGNWTMGIKFGNTVLRIPLTEFVGQKCPFSTRCASRFQITSGPYWILGDVFFRSFYSVFDSDTIPPRIGVAPLRRE